MARQRARKIDRSTFEHGCSERAPRVTKSCVRCGGRLEVRAVVTDLETARQIIDAMAATARAAPMTDSSVVYEPAFA